MVPPGQAELNAASNASQSLVIVEQGRQLKISLLHNTPAAFDGRPQLAEQLTEELKDALQAGGQPVSSEHVDGFAPLVGIQYRYSPGATKRHGHRMDDATGPWTRTRYRAA